MLTGRMASRVRCKVCNETIKGPRRYDTCYRCRHGDIRMTRNYMHGKCNPIYKGLNAIRRKRAIANASKSINIL